MRFFYAVMHAQTDRDAVFHRMQAEGLTACAMSSVPNPTLEQWQHITAPAQGVLLGCYAAQADRSSQGTTAPAQLLAALLMRLAPVFAAWQPRLALVQGDTVSALAGRLNLKPISGPISR